MFDEHIQICVYEMPMTVHSSRLSSPERLRAVDASGLHGVPGPQTIDDLVNAAVYAFGTASGVVSIVDSSTVWFAARRGLNACDIPAELSFCTRVVETGELFVILNAACDPGLADHPLVTGPPFVRFYAGVPFRDRKGALLGAVAVIDTEPRFRFGDEDRAALECFSRLATTLLPSGGGDLRAA